MTKSLETLIKLQKHEIDRKLVVIKQFENKKQEISEIIHTLQNQLEEETKLTEQYPELSITFHNYAESNRNQQKAMIEASNKIDAQLITLKKDIQTHFKQLKTYDIAKDNIQEQHKKTLEKVEQAELDEFAADNEKF